MGTPHNIERKSLAVGGWGVGGPNQEIIPLRGSILQADTCQILSLDENPRWSPSVAKICFLDLSQIRGNVNKGFKMANLFLKIYTICENYHSIY